MFVQIVFLSGSKSTSTTALKESTSEDDSPITPLPQSSDTGALIVDATHSNDTNAPDASMSPSPDADMVEKPNTSKTQSEDVVMASSANNSISVPTKKEPVEGSVKKKRKLGASPDPEASTSTSKMPAGKKRSDDDEDEKENERVSEAPVRKRKKKASRKTSLSALALLRQHPRRRQSEVAHAVQNKEHHLSITRLRRMVLTTRLSTKRQRHFMRRCAGCSSRLWPCHARLRCQPRRYINL